ncbi:MT-A70 family protein [Oxytricha trifallax]|uniref:mRNA m(6)A methyltransferase n=1 Tax=Oxytricha trifallax TaxID=1172189 RepID=A0A073ICE1_9SPIT|nr:MT-A70 family protein [Oxytricha trifallax]
MAYGCPVSNFNYEGNRYATYKHYERVHAMVKVEEYLAKKYECDKCFNRYGYRQSLSRHKKDCEERLKQQQIQESQNLANSNLPDMNLNSPPNPVKCDVTQYTVWTTLRSRQLQRDGNLFRAIIMDPPWESTMLNLGQKVLSDSKIKNIPINLVQDEGFIFMWVTNGKPQVALDFFKLHGYRWVETITWVKLDKKGNIFKGPGRYLTTIWNCASRCKRQI